MRRILHSAGRAAAPLLLSALLLELCLQLAFPLLPQSLIRQMPQYQLRLGFDLATRHGALEYPAEQEARYTIDEQFGDLYHLTCLSPALAPPFEKPYAVKFQRDKHGFRNEAAWPETVDLLLLGDSFTAAEAVQRPFWQGLADATLALGLPGSGTLEQERLFWHYGRPRQPKIVVLAYFGGNDLLDNEFFAAHFAAGQSRLDYVYQKHAPGDFLVSLHLLLALRAALGPAPATDCHYPLSSAARPPTPLAFFDRLLPQLATGKATLANSDGWQRARASISAMNQALTDQGGRLALLYIPQKAELYWQDLAAADKQKIVEALRAAEVDAEGSLSVAAIDNHIGAQAELLKDFTAQQGIAMLDTRPALRAAIAAGEQPYFFADTHWNQRGHDIARNVLREFLNRSTLEE